VTSTCGDAGATTSSRSDTLDIVAGSSAHTIDVATASSGCTFVYDVIDDDTATAQSGNDQESGAYTTQ
jgi:hypothetical protein